MANSDRHIAENDTLSESIMLDQNGPMPEIYAFNIESLKLTQEYANHFGVKRKITNVSIRKPRKDEFFRVHSDENWQLQTLMLDVKSEGEMYILSPDLMHILPDLAKPVSLHTAIDRQGNAFIIPLPLPSLDGRRNPWHDSLHQVILAAKKDWVRCAANIALGGYDLYVAENLHEEPVWPEIGFSELLAIACRTRLIKDEQHPVIQQLLGML